jgi:hypothetical protein
MIDYLTNGYEVMPQSILVASIRHDRLPKKPGPMVEAHHFSQVTHDMLGEHGGYSISHPAEKKLVSRMNFFCG